METTACDDMVRTPKVSKVKAALNKKNKNTKKKRSVVRVVSPFGATTSLSSSSFADLRTNGFVCVPMLNEITSLLTAATMQEVLSSAPELRADRPDKTTTGIAGSFGAAGTGSSFHNPAVRAFRKKLYKVVEEMMMVDDDDKTTWSLQMVHDRMSKREVGTTLSSESWHQDVSADYDHTSVMVIASIYNPPDSVLSQYFSCIAGSHMTRVSDKTGFATFDMMKQSGVAHQHHVHVEIPPGYTLFFNEQIVHEVLPGKVRNTSYRLYTKFIMYPKGTLSPWVPNDILKEMIMTQSVMPLHFIRGRMELSPMYPKLWRVNWLDKLSELTLLYREDCRDLSDKHKGVFRYMKSLAKLNCKFPDYTPDELALYLCECVL